MKKRHDLDALGRQISKIDISVMALLEKRFRLVRQVAQCKIKNEQKLIRLDVEKQRLDAVMAWAKTHDMDPNFAAQILYSIINESCKQQLAELQKSR